MNDSQSKIIITGAAGFIGSALAGRLNALGRHNLLLVDQLGTSTKWRNLVPLRYDDYMEKDEFFDAFTGGRITGDNIEAVVHLGACSSTTEADASYLARNNFEYTKRLASWCLDRSSPIRFIYASSAATYGDGAQGYRDDHAGIPALRPMNMYGYSKQMFDLWNLEQTGGDDMVGLKFFNVYGPNEYHKGSMRSMVVKAFEQIRDSGQVSLFKSNRVDYRDGEQMRDFVYVKDAVEMVRFCLDRAVPGGIYNVGTGTARSWIDLMHAVFHAMGKEPCIEFVEMPDSLRGAYQYYTQADPAKLLRAGFSAPIHTLEDGVTDYVKYLEAGMRPLGWDSASR